MNFRKASYALLFVAVLASCSSSKKNSATLKMLAAKELQPVGRYFIDEQSALHMVSSAVHFSVQFTGSEIAIEAALADTNAHNYLQYELDGVYQKRIRVNGNNSLPLLLPVKGSGQHTLTVYKATEAHTGDVIIRSIAARNIAAVAPDNAPIIEFIGNSITCGAAADPSETPCGTGQYHDQHNAYMAYGPRVARVLHTNYMLSSVSGIGIYRNWNSDGPTMPQVYEKTDFQDWSSRRWDFKTYAPKIVSIALGTNDFSNGDGKRPRLPFDSALFVNNYIQFVKLVQSKYAGVQVALLSSGMVNGANRELLQNCLIAVKQQVNAANAGAKPVQTFFFQPMQARGCSGHPNVDDHAILAAQLIPFFKGLLAQ